jgi:hypothetical protein
MTVVVPYSHGITCIRYTQNRTIGKSNTGNSNRLNRLFVPLQMSSCINSMFYLNVNNANTSGLHVVLDIVRKHSFHSKREYGKMHHEIIDVFSWLLRKKF